MSTATSEFAVAGADEVYDADAIDKVIASGGLPPEGKHHAVLDGIREVNTEKGGKGYELIFLILAGPAEGAKVKGSVWEPSPDQTDPGKRAKAVAKMIAYKHRLGVLKKDVQNGKNVYVPVTPGRTFQDAHGTDCIIDVVHEEYDETSKKDGKHYKGKRATLSYMGVLKSDDPDAKDVPRAGGAAVQAAVDASPKPVTNDSLKDL